MTEPDKKQTRFWRLPRGSEYFRLVKLTVVRIAAWTTMRRRIRTLRRSGDLNAISPDM